MSKCDKKQFTKREAEGALNKAKIHPKQEGYRKECRMYHCPECNMWHLTSKESQPSLPPIKPLAAFKKFLKK